MLRVAANLSLLYPDRPFADRCAAAAADGFRAVEILFPYDEPPEVLARRLDAHGLRHVLLNTPPGPGLPRGAAGVPGAEAAFREAFAAAMRVCEATGCRIVHTMAGDPPADASYAECVATLLANLAWAAPRAQAAGVVLTLEALNDRDVPGYLYGTPAQAVDVVRTLDHPNVRVQFDLFHTARAGLDLPDELRAALAFVHHVQIAGPPDRHEPDPSYPGLTEALTLLDASGYRGWLGFEYRPAGDTTAGLGWCAPLSSLLER